jgi:Zn finger protein HypA/HybF involved in hydrogenase expression
MRKLTTEEFITRSNDRHSYKYIYTKSEYIASNKKIIIICPIHGEFLQTPVAHMQGQGCPLCAGKIKKTNLTFIKKAQEIHLDKYDYSKVQYKNNKTNIIIICRKHGEFEQLPSNHLAGNGCPICRNEQFSKKRAHSLSTFIEKAEMIHGKKYDYSKVRYKNNYTKVEITCLTHGSFLQLPMSHLQGIGCPKCRESKGEVAIKDFLVTNNVKFEEQKKFKDCKNPDTGYFLRFDFYLPDYNLLIEYDGHQHYIPVRFNNKSENDAKDDLRSTQMRDKIKNQYCKDKNIKLLRIPYWKIKNISILIGALL